MMRRSTTDPIGTWFTSENEARSVRGSLPVLIDDSDDPLLRVKDHYDFEQEGIGTPTTEFNALGVSVDPVDEDVVVELLLQRHFEERRPSIGGLVKANGKSIQPIFFAPKDVTSSVRIRISAGDLAHGGLLLLGLRSIRTLPAEFTDHFALDTIRNFWVRSIRVVRVSDLALNASEQERPYQRLITTSEPPKALIYSDGISQNEAEGTSVDLDLKPTATGSAPKPTVRALAGKAKRAVKRQVTRPAEQAQPTITPCAATVFDLEAWEVLPATATFHSLGLSVARPPANRATVTVIDVPPNFPLSRLRNAQAVKPGKRT